MISPGKPRDPVPGYYRMRLVRGGAWVAVRVWLQDGERDEAGELVSDQTLRCKVGDRELPCTINKRYTIFLERQRLEEKDRNVWDWLWQITRHEYELMVHTGRRAPVDVTKRHGPGEGKAPAAIDLTKADPVF